MQETYPPPSPDLIGVNLTFGFIYLLIYALARISTEGADRVRWCTRISLIAPVIAVVLGIFPGLLLWNYMTPPVTGNPVPLYLVSAFASLVLMMPSWVDVLVLHIRWKSVGNRLEKEE
jgi:hypothetical protein